MYKAIISDGLKKARDLLGKNKHLLDTMARLLVERETIFSEEVDMIMEGKTVEEIMAFMDENEKTLSENPFERKNKVIISEPKKAEGVKSDVVNGEDVGKVKKPAARKPRAKKATEKPLENDNEKGE